MRIVLEGDQNPAGIHELGHDLKDDEGALRDDHLVARLEEGVGYDFKDLVGAVSQQKMLSAQPVELCQSPLQVVAASVGVSIHLLQRLPHGLERLGRRTQRVLI